MRAALGSAALGAALVAGCGSVQPWQETQPSSRYTVLPGSSKDCENAAKRATYYCEGKMTFKQPGRFEDQHITDCSNAQHDFQRYCR